MSESLKEKLTSREVWQRGGFIVIFALCYSVSKVIVVGIVLFQFFSLLITRETNSRLAEFSSNLASYIFQLLQYMLINTNEKPFPFAAWPGTSPAKSPVSTKKTTRKKTTRKKAATASSGSTKSDSATDDSEEKPGTQD